MRRTSRTLALGVLIAALAACAGAPVGAGYYRVKKGDTLSAIARRQGQSTAEIARWNNLANPNSIQVDQVLRVVPPAGALRTERAASAPVSSASGSAGGAASTPRTTPALPSVAPAHGITLAWPASGPVLLKYDGVRNKGINIGGNAGDPVRAAAAGTVVYAGSGLRGYGNLLIIKHDSGFLTAYAHNRRLLVKEGAKVASGQQVAEIGDTQSERVMLHFELRYQGRPIDPSKYLPPR